MSTVTTVKAAAIFKWKKILNGTCFKNGDCIQNWWWCKTYSMASSTFNQTCIPKTPSQEVTHSCTLYHYIKRMPKINRSRQLAPYIRIIYQRDQSVEHFKGGLAEKLLLHPTPKLPMTFAHLCIVILPKYMYPPKCDNTLEDSPALHQQQKKKNTNKETN